MSIFEYRFGGNNAFTTLIEPANSGALAAGNCVNGLITGVTGTTLSQFGEFAYCNAVAFFAAANQLIALGMITVPPPGITNLGDPCPTVRSFPMVDQDQSDNSLSPYLITVNGQVAQATAANIKNLNVITTVVNPSDNRLVAQNVLAAIGCTPFMAPDAIDGVGQNGLTGIMRSSIALNELQAEAAPNANPALVPSYDPMVLTSTNATTTALQGPAAGGTGVVSLAKINAYRVGVNQAPLTAIDSPTDVALYCTSMLAETGPFLAFHALDLSRAPSLIPAVASNLLALLVARFGATYNLLGCGLITGQQNPMIAFDPNGNPFNGLIPASTTNIAQVYPFQAFAGKFINALP